MIEITDHTVGERGREVEEEERKRKTDRPETDTDTERAVEMSTFAEQEKTTTRHTDKTTEY